MLLKHVHGGQGCRALVASCKAAFHNQLCILPVTVLPAQDIQSMKRMLLSMRRDGLALSSLFIGAFNIQQTLLALLPLQPDNVRPIVVVYSQACHKQIAPMDRLMMRQLKLPDKCAPSDSNEHTHRGGVQTRNITCGGPKSTPKRCRLWHAGLKPRDIDILVVNCSLFNPTPSLSAMIINHFKMRSDILSYNLAGALLTFPFVPSVCKPSLTCLKCMPW